jgi:hypothetical protein
MPAAPAPSPSLPRASAGGRRDQEDRRQEEAGDPVSTSA